MKRWDIYNFKRDLELLRGNKAAVRKIAKHPQKVPLSFTTWKVKALDAGLLTGKTDSARDMSARRLLATIKSSKWIEVHQGICKPTDEGIAELLG